MQSLLSNVSSRAHGAGACTCCDLIRLPGTSRRAFLAAGAAMGFAQAVALMAQSGFCGAYLAVIEEGEVGAGDAVTLQPGPREVSLRELFRARVGR